MQIDLGSVLVGALLTLVGALVPHFLAESSGAFKRKRKFRTLLNLLERELQIVEAVTAVPESVNPVNLPSLRLLVDRGLVDLMDTDVRDHSLNVETSLGQMQWLVGVREKMLKDAAPDRKPEVWKVLGADLENHRLLLRQELTITQAAVRQQLRALGVTVLERRDAAT